MNKRSTLLNIARIVPALLIASILFYVIFSVSSYGEAYGGKTTVNIERVIRKALIQCYALEGYYPLNIEYLTKYGVVFLHSKYVYYYEWYGGNLTPLVVVLEK